jgi:hypothetical protein
MPLPLRSSLWGPSLVNTAIIREAEQKDEVHFSL